MEHEINSCCRGGEKRLRKYTLKELRARKNETQQQTAKALGVSTQTYNAWEKDVSGVAIGKFVALAEHFGVTMDEIFLHSNMN